MTEHVSLIVRVRKYFSFNRLPRIHRHYLAIKAQLTRQDLKGDRKDKSEAALFMREFERYYRATSRLVNARFFFYCVMYATIIVNILKLIPLLSFLVAFLELGSALFGTALAVIVIFILTAKINVNYSIMDQCMMHLVALYHKDPGRRTDEALAEIRKAI